jgi:hypothetical protein
MQVGLIQSVEGLNRTKGLSKRELHLPGCVSWEVDFFCVSSLPTADLGRVGLYIR